MSKSASLFVSSFSVVESNVVSVIESNVVVISFSVVENVPLVTLGCIDDVLDNANVSEEMTPSNLGVTFVFDVVASGVDVVTASDDGDLELVVIDAEDDVVDVEVIVVDSDAFAVVVNAVGDGCVVGAVVTGVNVVVDCVVVATVVKIFVDLVVDDVVSVDFVVGNVDVICGTVLTDVIGVDVEIVAEDLGFMGKYVEVSSIPNVVSEYNVAGAVVVVVFVVADVVVDVDDVLGFMG